MAIGEGANTAPNLPLIREPSLLKQEKAMRTLRDISLRNLISIFITLLLSICVFSVAYANESAGEQLPPDSYFEIPPSIMFHARAEQAEILPTLIDDLLLSGYRFTTYSQYFEAIQNGDTLENPIILTFDDLTFVQGSMNFRYYERIVDVLEAKGVPAVFAVVTQPVVIGVNNRTVQLTAQNEAYLESARRWVQLGIEFATHTESHPNLDNPFLTQDDLNREISASAHWIEQQLSVRVTALITPFGSGISQTGEINPRVLHALDGTNIHFVVGISVLRQPLARGQQVYGIGRIMPDDHQPRSMISMLVGEVHRWTEYNNSVI